MRNLLDLMAISFITITFCNTVQQKIYYSHILPGNDGLDHSLACENGKYGGGRCNIIINNFTTVTTIYTRKKETKSNRNCMGYRGQGCWQVLVFSKSSCLSLQRLKSLRSITNSDQHPTSLYNHFYFLTKRFCYESKTSGHE